MYPVNYCNGVDRKWKLLFHERTENSNFETTISLTIIQLLSQSSSEFRDNC